MLLQFPTPLASTTGVPRLPAAETLKAYTAIAAPIFEQITNLQQQNQELTTLLDWLLPMLMTGQARVTG